MTSVIDFLSKVPQEELLAVVVPVVVYWLYSGFYLLLEKWNPKLFQARRLHSKADEKKKNLVTPGEVVRMVLFQQVVQILLAIATFSVDQRSRDTASLPPLTVQVLQFVFACFLMDTWQYFLHRLAHESRFLYRHLHSWHHRLLVPYPYGALYNHPVEGLLMDSVGGALSFALSGMPPRNALFFFTLATIKTVDDHCGIYTPWNPFHRLFRNNAAYHDVHHQVKGFRYNYSQPFFPFWDHVLGTHLPFKVVDRPDGGIEAQPILPAKTSATVPAKQAKESDSKVVQPISSRVKDVVLSEAVSRARPRRA